MSVYSTIAATLIAQATPAKPAAPAKSATPASLATPTALAKTTYEYRNGYGQVMAKVEITLDNIPENAAIEVVMKNVPARNGESFSLVDEFIPTLTTDSKAGKSRKVSFSYTFGPNEMTRTDTIRIFGTNGKMIAELPLLISLPDSPK